MSAELHTLQTVSREGPKVRNLGRVHSSPSSRALRLLVSLPQVYWISAFRYNARFSLAVARFDLQLRQAGRLRGREPKLLERFALLIARLDQAQ